MVIQMPPPETNFDPAKPLRNPKWERFAREAVCLTEPLEAMKIAGFAKPRAGNAARLLRNRKIAARMAILAQDDVEMVRARRARLRRLLDLLGSADRTELYEQPKRGRLKLKRFDDMSPAQRLLIDGIEMTKQGPMPIVPHRLQALAQLAKLDGLDGPTKVAATDSQGNDAPITDADRIRALGAIFAKVQAENAVADAAEAAAPFPAPTSTEG
jgi:hypothetical protein